MEVYGVMDFSDVFPGPSSHLKESSEISNNMDFSQLFTDPFLFGLLNIILSGAVVIAMAVRSLPKKERQWGIILGTSGVVLLRVGLTFVPAKLLEIPFVKLTGGLLILWIAFKLLLPGRDHENVKEVNGLPQAIITVLMADLVMSLDKVPGVAGALGGDPSLLVIGFGTSIPIVVFASNIIMKLMSRFPIIVLLGAAVLAGIAGEMIMSDPWKVRLFGGHPDRLIDYGVQLILAVGVVVAAKMWIRYRAREGERYLQKAKSKTV